jgi:beta-lactamase superfamily II metal-dependent hydrolase
MGDKLTVRVYNVRFGDAILVTIPDCDPETGITTTRRILIDVGNAPKVAGTGEGGADLVFEPVIKDILKELDGKPLDLYVMTHEHLDHVQGLFFASTKLPQLDFDNCIRIDHVWLPASAHPDYYETHPEAKKRKLEFDAMYARISAFLALQPAAAPHGLLEILANNDPTRTAQCVDYVRKLTSAKLAYVFRGISLKNKHPFREAKLSILAPEEDTKEYYGRFEPLDTAVVPAPAAPGATSAPYNPITPTPPAGVDVGAFMRLIESRRNGIADNLLAIDKAANNTSIVFDIKWRGWHLLFPGDAEIRSWKTMAKHNVLEPVHFLKVAHHGSHNGTPTDEIFDAILPAVPPDNRPRTAAISTWAETYSGIPHTPTNTRLSARASLRSILDDPDELFMDFAFAG